jgi:hypothetical protein
VTPRSPLSRALLAPLAVWAALALSCLPRPTILSPADLSALDGPGPVAVEIDLGTALGPQGSARVTLLSGIDSPPAARTDLTPRLVAAGLRLSGEIALSELREGRSALFVSVDADGDGRAENVASSSFSWEPAIDAATAHRCDPIDPSRCLYPFPNDRFTVADPTTDTGLRVAFERDSMPANRMGKPVEPGAWNENDGFSVGPKILTLAPGVDLARSGAPPITDIERSIDADSPIVLLDADTLERQIFWSEVDDVVHQQDPQSPDPAQRALIVRPAKNLRDGGRYLVAMRGLVDGDGDPIPPSRAFRVYRDRIATYRPVLEERRAHMEDLFAALERAGIARSELQIAWDFTVASTRNRSERMLHMRDDAFASLAGGAPVFRVTQVRDNVDANVLREVFGEFEVPSYLTGTGAPGALLTRGPGLLPFRNGTFTAKFRCTIPRWVTETGDGSVRPARPSLYGHGLLGDEDEVGANNVDRMANEHGFVFCATQWTGFAEEDRPTAFEIIVDFSQFPKFPERQHQGLLNFLFLGRLMVHPAGFASDAAFQAGAAGTPVIDGSELFYDGNSQGGIMGGGLAAFAQDYRRAVLGVPGMNFSTLLRRSVDFGDFITFFNVAYPLPLDKALALSMVEMLWERVEANGHANHLTADPYPGTPAKRILLHEAFGDLQVANVTTEVEARTIGAHLMTPALAPGRHSDVNPFFGIASIPSFPFDGSVLVVWDSGNLTPPLGNVPPRRLTPQDPEWTQLSACPQAHDADSHECPRRAPNGRLQKSEFLRTNGAVLDVCGGQPCRADVP